MKHQLKQCVADELSVARMLPEEQMPVTKKYLEALNQWPVTELN